VISAVRSNGSAAASHINSIGWKSGDF